MTEKTTPPTLSEEDQIRLLRLARKSLSHQLEHNEILSREEAQAMASGEQCRQLGNCFVTLHRGGELRGCIGTLGGDKPLFEAVASAAVSAAMRDPRFAPLKMEELDECEIEISVLSPFVEIDSVDEIEVGRHGLILETATSRGLLLPQVAAHYNWSPGEFLSQTYLKAGLPRSDRIGPRDKVFVFEARICSESDVSDEFPK